MGRVQGKVALVTGAGRGQGRSHAVRLAHEGADLVISDSCADVATVPYPMATGDDLEQTAELVRRAGGRVVVQRADVRSLDEVDACVHAGLEAFGHIDVVCANAGVLAVAKTWEYTSEAWHDVVDTNLTGTWHTVKATVPHMIEAGRGGSIIITSSLAGIKGFLHTAAYTASKHAVKGLMRTLANELGEHRIRVNTLHPTNVDTPMVHNDTVYHLYRPDLEFGQVTREEFEQVATPLNPIPTPYVSVEEISNAVVFLASDEARFVTGVAMPVDAGMAIK